MSVASDESYCTSHHIRDYDMRSKISMAFREQALGAQGMQKLWGLNVPILKSGQKGHGVFLVEQEFLIWLSEIGKRFTWCPKTSEYYSVLGGLDA